MALQSTGPLSLGDIGAEFGGTPPLSLSSYYGAAAGIPASGPLALSAFYGASSVFACQITGNQSNLDLASYAISLGWDGAALLDVTIAPGVILSASSTALAALTVTGSFPGGVRLTNQGTIVGMGGAGGNGRGQLNANSNGLPGAPGGPALRTTVPLTLTNTGTIAGGGGGGGGGGGAQYYYVVIAGGGGGGGRTGLTNSARGLAANSAGQNWGEQHGGVGTFSARGAGGARGVYIYVASGAGGAGGNWGANGSAGVGGNFPGSAGGAGGAAGAAVIGNAQITWITTGTRYGALLA